MANEKERASAQFDAAKATAEQVIHQHMLDAVEAERQAFVRTQGLSSLIALPRSVDGSDDAPDSEIKP